MVWGMTIMKREKRQDIKPYHTKNNMISLCRKDWKENNSHDQTLSYIKYLLHARHCAKHYICIFSFNLQEHNDVSTISTSILLMRKWTRGDEATFPKFHRIQTQVYLTPKFMLIRLLSANFSMRYLNGFLKYLFAFL